jgi:Calmodulin-binding
VKYVSKKDYGKIPEYLNKIKSRINEDYTYLAKIQEEDDQMRNRDKIMLQQAELEQLRDGLRRKYEYVNKEYQSITHIVNFDSQGLKRK